MLAGEQAEAGIWWGWLCTAGQELCAAGGSETPFVPPVKCARLPTSYIGPRLHQVGRGGYHGVGSPLKPGHPAACSCPRT